MNFTLNGAPDVGPEETTVAALVRLSTGHEAPAGVAVAVNGALVPRGRWAETRVGEGDRVEIVRAVAGG